MEKYLESTEYIDWDVPEVLAQAKFLANGLSEPEEIAHSCFFLFEMKSSTAGITS